MSREASGSAGSPCVPLRGLVEHSDPSAALRQGHETTGWTSACAKQVAKRSIGRSAIAGPAVSVAQHARSERGSAALACTWSPAWSASWPPNALARRRRTSCSDSRTPRPASSFLPQN